MLLKCPLLEINSVLLLFLIFFLFVILSATIWLLIAILLYRKEVLHATLDGLEHRSFSGCFLDLFDLVLTGLIWRHLADFSIIFIGLLQFKTGSDALINFHVVRDFTNFRDLFRHDRLLLVSQGLDNIWESL